jgi:hypothetical protein
MANSAIKKKFDAAMKLVTKIRLRMQHEEEEYNRFLQTLQNYEAKSIDIDQAWQAMTEILSGHADLLEEVRTFLPAGVTAGTSNSTASGAAAAASAKVGSRAAQRTPAEAPKNFKCPNCCRSFAASAGLAHVKSCPPPKAKPIAPAAASPKAPPARAAEADPVDDVDYSVRRVSRKAKPARVDPSQTDTVRLADEGEFSDFIPAECWAAVDSALPSGAQQQVGADAGADPAAGADSMQEEEEPVSKQPEFEQRREAAADAAADAALDAGCVKSEMQCPSEADSHAGAMAPTDAAGTEAHDSGGGGPAEMEVSNEAVAMDTDACARAGDHSAPSADNGHSDALQAAPAAAAEGEASDALVGTT